MQKGQYMRVQDAVRCFAEIQRSEPAFPGSTLSQVPIWFLVCESEEAESQVLSLVRDYDLTFETVDQWIEHGLLHILHTGWLNRNDPRSLERFRHGYDPDRVFRIRFDELEGYFVVLSYQGERRH